LEFGDIALKITLFMCKQVPTALWTIPFCRLLIR
jgi:hypothetical protein